MFILRCLSKENIRNPIKERSMSIYLREHLITITLYIYNIYLYLYIHQVDRRCGTHNWDEKRIQKFGRSVSTTEISRHIPRSEDNIKTDFIGLKLDVLDGYVELGTGPLAHFRNDGNEPCFPQKARNFLAFWRRSLAPWSRFICGRNSAICVLVVWLMKW